MCKKTGIVQRPTTWQDHDYNVRCRYEQLNEVARRNPRPLNHEFIFGDRYLHYLTDAYLAFREFLNMPKKEYKPTEWKGFVNHKLTEKEKHDFSLWDLEDDDVWLLYTQLLTEGYKIASSFNKGNSTYNVVLSCNDVSSPNVGYGLSAYHPNWYQAVRAVLFKHEIVFNRVWILEGVVRSEDDWG